MILTYRFKLKPSRAQYAGTGVSIVLAKERRAYEANVKAIEPDDFIIYSAPF